MKTIIEPFRIKAVEPIRFEKQPDPRLRDPDFLARFAGAYALGPQSLRVSVRGTNLVLTVPGQPPYALEPEADGTFSLGVMQGFWLEFETGEDGQVTAAVLHQPNGVFRAERQADGGS